MKVAVVLSNHLRTFETTGNFIKNFFHSKNSEYIIDFFGCTWDHNFDNFTTSERLKIQGDRTKREFRLSPDIYTDLSLEYLNSVLGGFPFKRYSILTKDDFFYWSKLVEKADFDSKSQAFAQYGEAYCKYKAVSLVNTDDYDYIFNIRFDVVPSSTLSIEEIVQNIEENVFYTEHLRIVKGFPHIGNWIMYGTVDSFKQYYGVLENRLNYLLSNRLIKDTEKNSFYFNKVAAGLMLNTELKWKKSLIFPTRVNQESLDNGKPIFLYNTPYETTQENTYIPDPHSV